MEPILKAAIVGCGCIAKVHAECLNELKNVNIIAFADLIQERAISFAQKYNGNAYLTLEEMLEKESIDVVHICTPHYLHVPMALKVLACGVNVFMEKPPVISFEQFKELNQIDTDKQLGICFQNRYNDSVIQVKKLLDSGEAGKIIGGRALVTWSRDEDYYTNSGWRGKIATEGGGVLINQAIHSLDLLTYFIGRPTYVDASMSNHHLKGIVEIEDTMEALIRYDGDKSACFYATTAYCANVPPIIEIACEYMNIRVEEQDATCFYHTGKVSKLNLEHNKSLGKSYYGAGHFKCIREFYKCILEGKKFWLSVEEVKDTMQLMLSIYESAKSGREIHLV